ncbi:GDSL-type esterase/lipase family protein [Pedobacter gandavensis]|uniref:Prolyl oligopeptidase family serine peptidase n=1 Tax=Pedobacter gandavensis TaxID=2679963 RepID=A0ABR6EUI8_9SPHI|nr:GDSL-type esterase/lipase family protein [Pedobacter gandavensis]MBB2148867.1 prolyl oligopeptidase family serine peptidase [Pedobacter gandavensis]
MGKVFKFFLIAVVFITGLESYGQSKTRIVCVGNSITFGSGLKDRTKESYPAQLQTLLGPDYEVLNFGVSGATMLKKGNKPYWNTPEFKQVLNSRPNLVFIKLGTNDSKQINRAQMADFVADYKDMVHTFQQLDTKPKVVLLLPLKAFSDTKFGISGTYLRDSLIAMVQKVAYDEQLELLDLYSLFADKEALLVDKVHPNAVGDGFIAERLHSFVLQKNKAGKDLAKQIKTPIKRSSFYGYEELSFSFKGREALIVSPKLVAKGMPWVWRARFFGHEPQTDIALLERGFHVVYCDVAELFGNAEAIGIWNDFYKSLQKMGFAKKAVMEGMSRGGVYVYNWAATNPDKVACVYADNPVLDLKSWPGGKGKGPGSKDNWAAFLKDYGYANDAEAAEFKGSPIDQIAAIVKGKYPMLHVCGDLDEVVPMAENSLPFAEKIKAAGGNIQLIHKPEGKHHPHSLPNPQPIVDFILKATGY